jgi:hypothetical protein
VANKPVQADAIIDDIRQQVTDSTLMDKFGLFPTQLVEVLIGLVLKNLLSSDDLASCGPPAKPGTRLGPVLADVRAGMDNRGLMEKYDLSPALLVRILTGFKAQGLISNDDLALRGPRAHTEIKRTMIADIKRGMERARLMEKHGLSRKKLNAKICELWTEGKLTQEEVARFQY